jgi:hypothetical protein
LSFEAAGCFFSGLVYLYPMVIRLFLCFLVAGLVACEKPDTIAPRVWLNPDTLAAHYLNLPYTDPGAMVIDNHDCTADDMLSVDNQVDVTRYGTYNVMYTATDAQLNSTTAIRNVDIILQPSDYFSTYYDAVDSCTSGNYSYVGLIQDCDCGDAAVTVSNISNFGSSATFTLPLSGTYREIVLLDTTRSGVSFEGESLMSPAADTLYWQYTISTGSDSDVCKSTWIKY